MLLEVIGTVVRKVIRNDDRIKPLGVEEAASYFHGIGRFNFAPGPQVLLHRPSGKTIRFDDQHATTTPVCRRTPLRSPIHMVHEPCSFSCPTGHPALQGIYRARDGTGAETPAFASDETTTHATAALQIG